MAVPEVVVEGVVFPSVARPPGSAGSHFLGGAGVRGLEIGGNFIKFTAIGVYLEDAAVSALANKWAGKTADELASDAAFFRDVVKGNELAHDTAHRTQSRSRPHTALVILYSTQHAGGWRPLSLITGDQRAPLPPPRPTASPAPHRLHRARAHAGHGGSGTGGHGFAGSGTGGHGFATGDFEKFTRVTMIRPLTGEQYAEKVTENCVAFWKAVGLYTDAEGVAVEKFKEVFKPETFPRGASILFTHSPTGILTVAFSKDSSVPAAGGVAIENKPLCEAVLESIIGEHGVSPAAKLSLAARVSELLTRGTAAAADAPQVEPFSVTV